MSRDRTVTTKPTGHGTVEGIQHLRWWAAAMVVGFHSLKVREILGMADPASFKFVTAGNLGVQIFFVISGFIITIVCLDRQNNAKLAMSTFALRRFIRIVPIMWVATLLYFAMKYVGTGVFDWPSTWRTFLLWPIGPMEFGALWTLRLEMFFYLLFGIVFLVDRRLWPIIALWFAAPIVVRLIDSPSLTGVQYEDNLVWVYLMGHQVGANIQFGLGVILGLLHNRRHAIYRYAIPGGAWTVGVLALGVLMLTETVPALQAPSLPAILVTSVLCGWLVYASIIARPTAGLFNRLSRLLGDASYSIYLFNGAVLLAMTYVLGRTGWMMGPNWLYGTLAGTLAVSACVAVHLLIEKPMTAWLRSRWEDKKEPVPKEKVSERQRAI